MAKLRITLKQHTPLIHFQWDQAGAILRATEVKPKLDKFLMKYAFKGGFEEYKQYLIGYKNRKSEEDFKDKKAFNYKLKIFNFVNLNSEEIEYRNIKSNKKQYFPNYFGNMGKDKKSKGRVQYNKFVYCDSLDIEFFCLDKRFLKIIRDNLPNFLMKHNFGQRQSKGFGSFFINDSNKYLFNEKEEYYDKNKIRNIKQLKYSFVVDFNHYKVKKDINNKNIQNKSSIYKKMFGVFKQINDIYSKIRRGSDEFEPYIKKYAKNKRMIWDKDAIKERYCNKQIYSKYDKYLIKDLLGLSSKEKWIKSDKTITKNHITNKKENIIERYQSSIFFKPINVEDKYIVYFEGIEICDKYLNQEFLIQCNGKGNLKLKTPKEFKIDEFLEYVQENNSNYIRNNRQVVK